MNRHERRKNASLIRRAGSSAPGSGSLAPPVEATPKKIWETTLGESAATATRGDSTETPAPFETWLAARRELVDNACKAFLKALHPAEHVLVLVEEIAPKKRGQRPHFTFRILGKAIDAFIAELNRPDLTPGIREAARNGLLLMTVAPFGQPAQLITREIADNSLVKVETKGS